MTKSLCAISYFFMDSNLMPHELVLDAAPFTRKTQDADNIALLVADLVDSHTTSSQLFYSLTTDNAKNVVNAVLH